MILTVNIGNTHITVGGYDHDTLRFCGRLHSDPVVFSGLFFALILATNTPSGWSICFRCTAHPRIRSRAAFWAVWCRC